MLSEKLTGWVLLSPALASFSLFVVGPLFWGLTLSLFKTNLMAWEWVGLRNFILLLKNPDYLRVILNTLVFVSICLPMDVMIPLLLALIIYQESNRMKEFTRFAVYLPATISGIIISLTWRWIFHPHDGMLNGILGTEIVWLSNPLTRYFAISAPVIAGGMGMTLVLYMSALNAVDRSLLEAAYIDGCSRRQAYFYVLIPQILPVVGFISIIRAIGLLQIWEMPFQMTGGGPGIMTTTMVLSAYHTAFNSHRFGYASAQCIILVLVIGISTFLQRRYAWKI